MCLPRGTLYILRSAHTANLCVVYGSQGKQRLFDWLVFITETCGYCAVGTEYLNRIPFNLVLYVVNNKLYCLFWQFSELKNHFWVPNFSRECLQCPVTFQPVYSANRCPQVRTSTKSKPAFSNCATDRPPRKATVIRSSLSWKRPPQTN